MLMAISGLELKNILKEMLVMNCAPNHYISSSHPNIPFHVLFGKQQQHGTKEISIRILIAVQ